MKRVLVIAVLAAASCARKEATPPAPKPGKTVASVTAPDVGTKMPEYKAQWLDGSPFDLESQKGSVVLLNVWATWCGPCRFEIPELEKMHAAYGARGFKVIGVSVDEDGAKSVAPFVTEQKINYPIALDPDGKLASMLQTTEIPTSVLVDRRGKVVWKHFGIVSRTDPMLTHALESALNEKS